MTFADAWRTEDQNRGSLLQPGITGGQCADMGLGQHGYRGEVEARQRLGRIELRLGTMALDAALAAFGHLMFEQRGQKPAGLPAFFVGALSELGPQSSDGGQS